MYGVRAAAPMYTRAARAAPRAFIFWVHQLGQGYSAACSEGSDELATGFLTRHCFGAQESRGVLETG